MNLGMARKSSENGGASVELASLPNIIATRDSKNPNGPKLLLSRGGFRCFVDALKNA
jgi:hypothetical protein